MIDTKAGRPNSTDQVDALFEAQALPVGSPVVLALDIVSGSVGNLRSLLAENQAAVNVGDA